MLSKVVLPQPEGPIMAMNSPFRTSIFTCCSAFVSTVSERKLLLMFSSLIIVLMFRFDCTTLRFACVVLIALCAFCLTTPPFGHPYSPPLEGWPIGRGG